MSGKMNPMEAMAKMQANMASDPQMSAAMNAMGGAGGLQGMMQQMMGGGGMNGMVENMMESMGMGRPPPGLVDQLMGQM